MRLQMSLVISNIIYRMNSLSSIHRNIVVAPSSGIPTNGLTFSLDFSSPTIPATDTFGSTLTQNGTSATQPVTLAYDSTRGYVLYTGPAFSRNSISTNYATPSSFTRSFWVYFFGTGNYSDCVICSTRLPIVNYVGSYFGAFINYQIGGQVNLTTTTIGTGVWTHCVFTYNGTTCTLYINGASRTSANANYAGESGTVNGGGLCLGDYNNGGFTSNAFYDQIHCYNRALTAAEVLQIYNFELGLSPSIIVPPYLRHLNMFYAFSVRIVNPTYSGPVFNLRRSSDNATSNFYTDATQSYLTTGANNTGTSFATWIGANTAFVVTWYDQSGQRNNATQATTGNQPRISLQTNNSVSKYTIFFTNSTATCFLSLTTAQSTLTVFCHYYMINTNSGTILCAPIGTDFGVRTKLMPTGGNTNDWYQSGGGTKYVYNNGASVTSLPINTWNSMASSITTYSTTSPQVPLRNIGTDGFQQGAHGMTGYMTEMIGHNSTYISSTTSTITSDFSAFYTNRLF